MNNDKRLVPHQTIDPERFALQMDVFARMRATILEGYRELSGDRRPTIDFELVVIVDGVPVENIPLKH